MKHYGKSDANQKKIVQQLRELFGKDNVIVISQFPTIADIIVGIGGRTYLYEIKNPAGKNQETATQIKYRNFKGHRKVIRSAKEIINDISH